MGTPRGGETSAAEERDVLLVVFALLALLASAVVFPTCEAACDAGGTCDMVVLCIGLPGAGGDGLRRNVS
jgi:hypothetical protein